MDQYSREFIAEKARLRLDRFYRATRELGRVFKTEFILDYLSQPNRNADGPLEERHRPQTQIPQLLQADHGGPTRSKSPEHNDRARTACVRTHLLTLRLGKGRIPFPSLSVQQGYSNAPFWDQRANVDQVC